MESKANFLLVGIFITVFGLALISFIFWMGKYGDEADSFDYYKAYITDSVSGLNPESPVKYKGMEIGSVQSLSINPNNSEEIEVSLKIKKGIPIKEDNYITLAALGITGLSYIEIEGGSNAAPLLKKGDEVAIIPSQKSFLSELSVSAKNIAKSVDEAVGKISILLNEKNLDNIGKLLANLGDITSHIQSNKANIDALLQNGVVLERQGIATLQNLDETMNTTQSMFSDFQKTLNRGDYNLKAIANEPSEKLTEMMDEMKQLLNETQMAVRELKESPSDILFKSSVNTPGPGEK